MNGTTSESRCWLNRRRKGKEEVDVSKGRKMARVNGRKEQRIRKRRRKVVKSAVVEMGEKRNDGVPIQRVLSDH